MLKKVFIPAFLALTLSITAFGQLAQADVSQNQARADSGIDLSNDFISLPSHLYNGIEYVNYDNHIDGHQFFESPVLEEGSVIYDGMLYRNVPMEYDLMKDELVIEHFQKYYKISLISERVSQFMLLNHTFVRIVAGKGEDIRTGFYEKLYEGNVKILARRTKIMEEEIAQRRLKQWFTQKNRYYVYKDKAYFQVKNKKGLIKVLDDRKKEVRKFIQENGINFKTDIEQAFIHVGRFYDTLSQ
ncbi:hypothetical protein GXP67_02090 [Rhodocytophaga rosea]|uniref:Uncharacterized protein n=1 Tax=Rhodocytophaga rosea TaxID=2704465 RepID=A0A6C0GCX7_9BACT|nr:hypothetical protein [Rhodocytophaga rosea]QHT65540.1 hypothetical protein GXP67_02090 [Rhodocytophaga rosea]